MIAALSSRFVRRRVSKKGTFVAQLLEFKHVLTYDALLHKIRIFNGSKIINITRK